MSEKHYSTTNNKKLNNIKNPAAAGFFVCKYSVNFKDFFNDNTSGLGSKTLNSKLRTGPHQHQGNRDMFNRKKGIHLVAKSQSQKKRAEHPKIDLCIRTKKDTPLTTNDAFDIMNKKNTHPTPEEKFKRFKKLPIGIEYVKPQVYILRYLKDEENKWRL